MSNHGPLPRLLLVLTVVSGLLDAVSFLRLDHVFVANMTGNLVFVGLGAARATGFSLGVSLTALAGFLGGAAGTSALLARFPDRARLLRTSTLVKLALEVPVLTVAADLGIAPNRTAVYLFTALLATSMGVQNATVQRLGLSELPTTVVTTTLTRLVVGLSKGRWRQRESGYRAASIACLFAGAAVGAVLVLEVDAVSALGLSMVLLASVGFVAHRGALKHAAWTSFPTLSAPASDPKDGGEVAAP